MNSEIFLNKWNQERRVERGPGDKIVERGPGDETFEWPQGQVGARTEDSKTVFSSHYA